MEREYISIEEATKRFPFSRTSLYRLRDEKRLTFYRVPHTRNILLKVSELEALSRPAPEPR